MYEQLKLDNQLCFRLYTASRLIAGAYGPYFESLGITYPQYLVLLVLWEKDQQPVNDIAKRLLLETNTVTPLLQRMEKAGLVTRVKGETDARQRIVCLTDDGKALQEQAKDIPGKLAEEISRHVQVNELTAIIPALDKLIQGLQERTKEHRIKDIYFAGGCFWGVEHYFKQVKGVISTETGFANGNSNLPAPSYEQVYTDTTGYAETVHIVYDETQVAFDVLLDLFFDAIDPTSLNKQGHDEGTRYRTGIYFTDDEQREKAQARLEAERKKYDKPVVVQLEPLRAFYPAEEFHQDYLEKHPDGYCHLSPALFERARKINRIL